MMARGGAYSRGALVLYFGPRGWVLTRGRALIREQALTRGNTPLRNFGGTLWEMRKWQIVARPPLVCFFLDRLETKAKITLGDYSEHTQRPLLLYAAKTCAKIL